MPLYEYQCKKCKHRFEKIQKFSDPPEKKCPECGGAVEQVLSAPAVQFKGTGWYVTDYAHKSGASSGNGKGGEKTKTENSSESKPSTPAKNDSKPSSEAKP